MKKLITIVIMCCCTLLSCRYLEEDDLHHYTVTFYNNSDQWVYIYGSNQYYVRNSTPKHNVLHSPDIYKVAPHSYNKRALEIRGYWEDYLVSIPKYELMDTLMIFVYDDNMLETTKKYNYEAVLQRIDVTLEDLRKSNWVISYPHK